MRNIAHDLIDHATVTAINNIAHSVGKQTVAEFVVDSATSDVIKALGGDFGQGFALEKLALLARRLQYQMQRTSV